ncbi:hypothetical protein EON66_03660 [archaeon]|nr:MAG: hypothetical protein EON66_03660 [archaeon]
MYTPCAARPSIAPTSIGALDTSLVKADKLASSPSADAEVCDSHSWELQPLPLLPSCPLAPARTHIHRRTALHDGGFVACAGPGFGRSGVIGA